METKIEITCDTKSIPALLELIAPNPLSPTAIDSIKSDAVQKICEDLYVYVATERFKKGKREDIAHDLREIATRHMRRYEK